MQVSYRNERVETTDLSDFKFDKHTNTAYFLYLWDRQTTAERNGVIFLNLLDRALHPKPFEDTDTTLDQYMSDLKTELLKLRNSEKFKNELEQSVRDIQMYADCVNLQDIITKVGDRYNWVDTITKTYTNAYAHGDYITHSQQINWGNLPETEKRIIAVCAQVKSQDDNNGLHLEVTLPNTDPYELKLTRGVRLEKGSDKDQTGHEHIWLSAPADNDIPTHEGDPRTRFAGAWGELDVTKYTGWTQNRQITTYENQLHSIKDEKELIETLVKEILRRYIERSFESLPQLLQAKLNNEKNLMFRGINRVIQRMKQPEKERELSQRLVFWNKNAHTIEYHKNLIKYAGMLNLEAWKRIILYNYLAHNIETYDGTANFVSLENIERYFKSIPDLINKHKELSLAVDHLRGLDCLIDLNAWGPLEFDIMRKKARVLINLSKAVSRINQTTDGVTDEEKQYILGELASRQQYDVAPWTTGMVNLDGSISFKTRLPGSLKAVINFIWKPLEEQKNG